MGRAPGKHRTVNRLDAELVDEATQEAKDATGRYVGDREAIERALERGERSG